MAAGVLALLLSCGPAWAQSSSATPIQVPLGAAARYGLLSGDSILTGNYAMAFSRAGAQSLPFNVEASDTVFTQSGGNVSQALIDLQAARNYCAALAGQAIGGNLGGQMLTQGAYAVAGTASCTSGTSLTLTGDSTSVFVLTVGGNLAFGANSSVLLNGVRPENVFWNVNGNITVASSANVSGVLMSGATITMQGIQAGRYAALAAGDINLTNLVDLMQAAPSFYSALALAFRPTNNLAVTCSEPAQQASACNLVLNGSFGCADYCPAILSGTTLQGPPDKWLFIGGPLYFRNCGPVTSYSVPNNLYTIVNNLGMVTNMPVYSLTHTPAQYPLLRNNDAYVGIFAEGEQVPGIGYQDTRQYASQPLTTGSGTSSVSIIANQRYYAEFYYQIAPTATNTAKSLGLALSAGLPVLSAPGTIPQIIEAIPTGTDWQRIGGVFTPTIGIAQPYLTVGDFSTMTAVDIPLHNNGPWQGRAGGRLTGRAYYFIDEVLLSLFPEAGPSYTYCGASPVTGTQLGTCALPLQTGATYFWTPSIPDPTLNQTLANPTVRPTSTTTYTLQVTVNGRTWPAGPSANITILPFSVGPPRSICLGQSVPLSVTTTCPLNGATYFWTASPSVNAGLSASNVANPTATPLAPGTYVYTLTTNIQASNGVPATTINSSITITVAPTTAGPPQTITGCGSAATLIVQCPQAGATYTWTGPGGFSVTTTATTLLVSPSVTTTFSLQVTLPGQAAISGGSTTVTVTTTRTYVHNGTALPGEVPYDASLYPPYPWLPNGTPIPPQVPNQPYDIGYPSPADFTRINGNGQTVIFDGVYHVRGNLEFTNGHFILRPGTFFYVDNVTQRIQNWCPLTVGQLNPPNNLGAVIEVGDDALLEMQGAALTANCDVMWGGVLLNRKGSFKSDGGSIAGRYYDNEISHARVGLLLGDACLPGATNNPGSPYDVRNTRFENNTFGMVVLGNRDPLDSDNGVRNCHFSSDLSQRLYPDSKASPTGGPEYTRIGLVLGGRNHQDITYTDNEFSELAIGAEIGGNSAEFVGNKLVGCYDTAIRLGDPAGTTTSDGPKYLGVYNNIIEVPDTPNPGGQINPATVAQGIEMLDLRSLAWFVAIAENEITSYGGPRTTRGIQAFLNAQQTHIVGNTCTDLNEGLRLLDASSMGVQDKFVRENSFDRVGDAVIFDGAGYGVFAPQVTCNDFLSNRNAIVLTSSTNVGFFGNSLQPCDNKFQGIGGSYVANGSGSAVTYFYDADRNEIPPRTMGATYVDVYGATSYCSLRGLFRQQSTASATSAQAADWENLLLTQNGSATELQQVEVYLLRYTEDTDTYSHLTSFTAQLPFQNPASFRRLSLYLMEYYRRIGQEGEAQRLKAELLNAQGNDPEVAYRVQYFDVLGRLRQQQLAHQPLAPADSLALAGVAQSGTGFASVACALLHALRPAYACLAGDATGQAGAQAKGTRFAASPAPAAATTGTVRAYPNPAHDWLTVEAPAAVAGAFMELVEVSIGRIVRSQPLSADGRAVVDVRGLAPGVYRAQVQSEGRSVGSCKVVILP